VEVVVLNVDRENRRISLGYKQTKPDPWPELSKKFAIGNETSGKILRLLDRGVIVDLGEEVEGFVPTIHLGKPEISKPVDAFNEGDVLPLKVTEFDHPGKKIVLSVEAYYRTREKKELDDFLGMHPTKTQKVEEIVDKRPELEAEKTAVTEKPAPAQPVVSESQAPAESEKKPEEAKADAPSAVEEKASAPAGENPDTSTEEPPKEADA
jgi:small subunit ribosomal protein S1